LHDIAGMRQYPASGIQDHREDDKGYRYSDDAYHH